ncbi:hypothetical protein KDA14_00930 [Candidatus Saccharibacteria bacterium]|nr:hypothetical protein [Candidatus Saccharibacteria bacterium]
MKIHANYFWRAIFTNTLIYTQPCSNHPVFISIMLGKRRTHASTPEAKRQKISDECCHQESNNTPSLPLGVDWLALPVELWMEIFQYVPQKNAIRHTCKYWLAILTPYIDAGVIPPDDCAHYTTSKELCRWAFTKQGAPFCDVSHMRYAARNGKMYLLQSIIDIRRDITVPMSVLDDAISHKNLEIVDWLASGSLFSYRVGVIMIHKAMSIGQHDAVEILMKHGYQFRYPLMTLRRYIRNYEYGNVKWMYKTFPSKIFGSQQYLHNIRCAAQKRYGEIVEFILRAAYDYMGWFPSDIHNFLDTLCPRNRDMVERMMEIIENERQQHTKHHNSKEAEK